MTDATPPMDTPDPKDALEVYRAARDVAQFYYGGMGDPLYALHSSGAIVYAGVVTLKGRLLDEAATIVADDLAPLATDQYVVALEGLARIIDRSEGDIERWSVAEAIEDERDYGFALSARLRTHGIPVGPPQVERGWSRGPRWVLPQVTP